MRHAPAPGRRATRAIPEPVRQFQIRCGSGRIRLPDPPDPAKNRALEETPVSLCKRQGRPKIARLTNTRTFEAFNR